jgi:hypothetical protein
MWRFRLFLRGLGQRLIRGGGKGIASPELVLLHQELLRLERRIEILEAQNVEPRIETARLDGK